MTQDRPNDILLIQFDISIISGKACAAYPAVIPSGIAASGSGFTPDMAGLQCIIGKQVKVLYGLAAVNGEFASASVMLVKVTGEIREGRRQMMIHKSEDLLMMRTKLPRGLGSGYKIRLFSETVCFCCPFFSSCRRRGFII